MSDIALEMHRGDRRAFLISVSQDGTPVDLAAMVGVRFTAKRDYADADSAAVIRKTMGAGIETTETTGQARVLILPADTVDLTDDVTLVWDLQITDADGPETPVAGTLHVKLDVTQTVP